MEDKIKKTSEDKLIEELAKPGIYHNIPFETYLKIPAVNKSYLYKHKKVPANVKVEKEDTTAMLIGRALHKYVLEGPEAFEKHYAIGPDVRMNTKIGVEKWVKFEMENEGKVCIRPKDLSYEMLNDIYNAIREHPAANVLLKDGLSEKTIVWRDEETGLLCKARPDKHPSRTEFVIVDYKSTTDASERGFLNDVLKFGYHVQDAMYSEGMKILEGRDFLFAFVVVEKKPPFRTEVYTLEEDLRKIGNSEFHRLLRVEKQCRDSNTWVHYENAGAGEISCPKWLKEQYPEVFPEVI